MSKINILRSVSRTLLVFMIASAASFNTIAQDDTTAAASGGGDAALISQGEQLFKENCKSCHKVHEESVGPALSGVTKRRKSAWLHDWIRNSSKMIAAGDKDAVELFNKYNKTQMTSFPTFTDEQINALLVYVESVPKEAAPAAVPTDGSTPGAPNSGSSNDTIILGLVVVVLILVLVVLGIFISTIKKFLKEKEANLNEADKELVNQSFDLKKFVTSKGFIGIVSVLFVVITVRACWIGMMGIGVHQNYQPVQPIPFSHKLHAGDLKINCNYCHTTVYKSRSASIPSLNICMNCHTYVDKGPSGSTEIIGKIKEAYSKNEPIRWIRVHNLPDLAYFNHSQHTTVAGIECQKCHGPIQEMEVVKQYSNLTMGWCINCHRETAVNSKDNEYYDRLLKVHEQSKKKGDMTVENIGGLDCSKCHY